MGCWNETDALTKLPIVHGEKIVFFVLGSTSEMFFKADRYLSDDLYQPIGLPFYGTYNDYGGIDLDPEKAEYHDKYMSTVRAYKDGHEQTSIQDFLQNVDYGEAGMTWTHGVYSKMMVKADVWEALLKEVSQRTYGFMSGETNREHFEKVLDQVIEVSLEIAQAIDQGLGREAMSHEFKRTRIVDSLFISGFWGTLTPYFKSEITPDVKENMVRLMLTNLLLSYLRLGWTPQFGSGSQSVEIKLTELLAKEALREIDLLKSNFDDEYDEDEDEDN